MCMKIKMKRRIFVNNFFAEAESLFRVENTQSIRKHKSLDIFILQRINQIKYILFRMDHTVRPVFEININLHVSLFCLPQYVLNIMDMSLGSFFQLFFKMTKGTFAKQIYNFSSCIIDPVQ